MAEAVKRMISALFTNNMCKLTNWTGGNGRGDGDNGEDDDDGEKEKGNPKSSEDELAFILDVSRKVPFSQLKCCQAVLSEYE